MFLFPRTPLSLVTPNPRMRPCDRNFVPYPSIHFCHQVVLPGRTTPLLFALFQEKDTRRNKPGKDGSNNPQSRRLCSLRTHACIHFHCPHPDNQEQTRWCLSECLSLGLRELRPALVLNGLPR